MILRRGSTSRNIPSVLGSCVWVFREATENTAGALAVEILYGFDSPHKHPRPTKKNNEYLFVGAKENVTIARELHKNQEITFRCEKM